MTAVRWDEKVMKDVYIEALLALAEEDSRIVVLNADLMNSDGTVKFAEAFPHRAVNVGVQEANMVGMAAGLAAVGKIPLAHTFACFHARRALDQAYMSGAYAGLPIKLVGTDPGITAAYNGGTHMPLEDVGVFRGIPDMLVVEVVDTVSMQSLLPQVVRSPQPAYLRISRKETETVYERGQDLNLGKGVVLRPGSDVTIAAAGLMTAESLRAADILAGRGISARVVHFHTVKPLDRELLADCARTTGAVVTAENHNINNGLGSAVAEVLGEECPVPLHRIGVQDRFGEVGSVEYLQKTFGMTAADVAAAAQTLYENL